MLNERLDAHVPLKESAPCGFEHVEELLVADFPLDELLENEPLIFESLFKVVDTGGKRVVLEFECVLVKVDFQEVRLRRLQDRNVQLFVHLIK